MTDFQKLWAKQGLMWFVVVLLFGLLVWKYDFLTSVVRASVMGLIGGYVMALIESKNNKK